MWEKILAIKAKAERDIILAQAKIEVADELLASLDAEKCEPVEEVCNDEPVETANPSTIF